FRAHLMNNDTAAVISADNANSPFISHEYNFYDFNIFCNADQQGVAFKAGVNAAGCTMWLHGNMSSSNTNGTPTNNIAALTVTGSDGGSPPNGPRYSRLFASEIVMKVEGNNGPGTGTGTFPYGIYFGGSNNAIKECHGIIAHSLTDSKLGPNNINGGEFSF